MALFENFPYTNIHELNLDWIVKIAKDFLEQYTHIQQLIEDGETSLVNLKNEGLAELQEKADTLEAALQAWYDTHSEDIAQELASALADLNAWYTEHENYLDQTLQDNITAFQQRANGIGAEVIASIPSDYTDLSKRVQYLNNYTGGELIESIFGLGGWTGNVGFTRTNAHGVCITLKNASRKMWCISWTTTRRAWSIRRNTCRCLPTAVGNTSRITPVTAIFARKFPKPAWRMRSSATRIPSCR